VSHHIEKTQATLARAVQQVISQGLHDPRASGLISVTKIDLSPDMANALVFVSIFPEDRQELSMHALRHAAKHIRHEASELIEIRRMPHLEFRLDMSLKHQAQVYQALAKAGPSGSSPTPAPAAELPVPAAPRIPDAEQANTSPGRPRHGRKHDA